MEDYQTWQELLRSVISDPGEHQRIAREIGVNPVTLSRWANRSSRPRLANLRPLLGAVPQQGAKLQVLLQKDYPKIPFEDILKESIVPEIPSSFYSSILNLYTSSPPILRSSTICVTIFQQMLRQLDPLNQGVQVVVYQCVPPSPGEKVRSLRFLQGRGTPQWEHHVENFVSFLGLESQLGVAVSQGHAIITQTRGEHENLYPGHEVSYAQSTAAYPLLYFDRAAGTLGIFSAQRNYFTPAHMRLMQSYAELLVLAFEPDQFYPLHEIGLDSMPPNQIQQPYLQTFQPRVTKIMLETEQNHQQIKRAEAELQAWKEIEEDLLQLGSERQEYASRESRQNLSRVSELMFPYIVDPMTPRREIPITSPRESEQKSRSTFALQAIIRVQTEENNAVFIDKDYVLRAGIRRDISETRLPALDEEAFLRSTERVIFSISLHNSNNIELLAQWQEDLHYTVQDENLQFVEFPFRFVSLGLGTIIVDFYYGCHWLRTLRVELLAKNVSSSPTHVGGTR